VAQESDFSASCPVTGEYGFDLIDGPAGAFLEDFVHNWLYLRVELIHRLPTNLLQSARTELELSA
jgi:hypothetical protein